MKIVQFLKNSLLVKIASLNAPIIIVRQIISLFVRRIITENFGAVGLDIMGQLRSIIPAITSLTSAGGFNYLVKYIAQHKDDKEKRLQIFSTVFVFWIVLSTCITILLIIFSEPISLYVFDSKDYSLLIIIIGLIAPIIGLQRLFNGVANGLTEYKKFAKVDIIAYLVSTAFLFYFVWNYQFEAALITIAITPAIQLLIMLWVFHKVFLNYIAFKKLQFKVPYKNELFAFAIISFVSTFVLSNVEIGIRNLLRNTISQEDSGIWSGLLDLSKNYLAFSSLLFTMYVIPKFATITLRKDFFKEVGSIYKTILPIFGLGMIAVYFLRFFIIDLIYPGLTEMAPLFKWQLLGDFIRLGAQVLAFQFLAKKMVRNFIVSELFSTLIFFGLAYYLVRIYGTEGVVIAHFIRYILYFIFVFFLINRSFSKKEKLVK